MAKVSQVLATKGNDVVTIGPDKKVVDAVTLMNSSHIGAVVLIENDQIAGIFTERDLLVRVVGERKDPQTTVLRDVMTSDLAFCTRETDLETCRSGMTRHKIRHLPVVEDGKLIGVISIGDIMAHEMKTQAEAIQFMHDYMTGPN